MAEYTMRDLILDRQRKPYLTTRFEVRAAFLDGHELRRRRYDTEQEAQEAVNRIRRENFNGYRKGCQWVETQLLACTYVAVKVPTFFRPK